MLVRKIAQSLLQTALIVFSGAAMMLMFTTPSHSQTQTVPSPETQLEENDSTIPQDDLEKTSASDAKPASAEELSENVSEKDPETDYRPVTDLNP